MDVGPTNLQERIFAVSVVNSVVHHWLFDAATQHAGRYSQAILEPPTLFEAARGDWIESVRGLEESGCSPNSDVLSSTER
eukprot:6492384-Amphidinium_carterae.6